MNWQGNKYIVPLFFGLYLLVGLVIVPDYGMSWDEDAQRNHGLVSADYIADFFEIPHKRFFSEAELTTYKDRTYGVLFPLTGFALERILGLEDFRSVFLLRHYMVFLLFWLASIVFFKTLKLRFEDVLFALVGTLFFILSPRIFAQSFYNPKDIVLMCAMVFSFYSLLRFLQEPSARTAFIHGLLCAVAVNTRIVGILMPALSVLMYVLVYAQRIFHGEEFQVRLGSRYLLLWFSTTLLFSYLFWPYLWEAPVTRLQEAFTHMAKYPWTGSNFLYGERYPGTENPWFYLPAWIIATTPLLYILAATGGIFKSLSTIVNNLWRNKKLWSENREMIDFLSLGLFLGPLFLITWKESVVYNGWRQVYFVYPFLLLTGLSFLNFLLTKFKGNTSAKLVKGLIACQIAFLIFFLVRNHPFQMTYFSPLAGTERDKRFEVDYWGLSYQQALDKVSTLHPDSTIAVACSNYPGWLNYRFAPKEVQEKLHFTRKSHKSDYFLTNFSDEIAVERRKKKIFPYDRPIEFAFTVAGDTIMIVYRRGE